MSVVGRFLECNDERKQFERMTDPVIKYADRQQ